jgi:hypothetical protein
MYQVVASRRIQWDQLLWQVPVLSLTAQAFLFTIALGGGSSQTARVIAAILSLVMTVLSIHLMTRHRQAEITDADWLESYELQRYGESVHGTVWRDRRNATRQGGWPNRIRGYRIWIGGLLIFGAAAMFVLVIAFADPSLLG